MKLLELASGGSRGGSSGGSSSGDKMKENDESCFSYKIDMHNNMCIKIPDYMWVPKEDKPTGMVCPNGGKLIDNSNNPITMINKYDFSMQKILASAPSDSFCIKCINGTSLLDNNTCGIRK